MKRSPASAACQPRGPKASRTRSLSRSARAEGVADPVVEQVAGRQPAAHEQELQEQHRGHQDDVAAAQAEAAHVAAAELEQHRADDRREERRAPAHLRGAGAASGLADGAEDEQVLAGHHLAVAEDLLALADLEEHLAHGLPLVLDARAGLGVLVGEVGADRTPHQVPHRAAWARGQVGELIGGELVHLGPDLRQVADAVDVAHQRLGASRQVAVALDRPHGDAALPLCRQQLSLLGGVARGAKPRQPHGGALDGGVEARLGELEVVVVVDHRLQRLEEPVFVTGEELQQLGLLGRGLVLGDHAGADLLGLRRRDARSLGGVQLLPLLGRRPALREGRFDAGLQQAGCRGVEVVDGPHRPRRFVAPGLRGLGVEHVVVAVGLDGDGRDAAERLIARDGRRQPRRGEHERRRHHHREQEPQAQERPHAAHPHQPLPPLGRARQPAQELRAQQLAGALVVWRVWSFVGHQDRRFSARGSDLASNERQHRKPTEHPVDGPQERPAEGASPSAAPRTSTP